MRNLAPNIIRQRLLIEGFYSGNIARKEIGAYFKKITSELNLKMYGKPVIFSPGGMGKKENQGYDAFVPLIDSGISLYVWTNAKFFSAVIYTCKGFNVKKAAAVTRKFFKAEKSVYEAF